MAEITPLRPALMPAISPLMRSRPRAQGRAGRLAFTALRTCADRCARGALACARHGQRQPGRQPPCHRPARFAGRTRPTAVHSEAASAATSVARVVSRHAGPRPRRRSVPRALRRSEGEWMPSARLARTPDGRRPSRVAVPARRRHAFPTPSRMLRADLGRVQPLQERQDGLQVVKGIFLLDCCPAGWPGDDLRHIGGYSYLPWRESRASCWCQLALVRGSRRTRWPRICPRRCNPASPDTIAGVRRGLDQIKIRLGQKPRDLAQRAHAELIHLGHLRAKIGDGLLRAGHIRGDELMRSVPSRRAPPPCRQ